ncbi:hypothetical protein FBT53_14685 [Flavobacterium sp. ASW18X]|nr:hypothetical protein FBT53_14685 [Flavobacterium sp. ASW18X]
MGIYEFQLLNKHDQCQTLFSQGTFVDVRIENHYRYAIYSLHQFWVQVSYNQNTNTIEHITAFIAGPLLDAFATDLTNL